MSLGNNEAVSLFYIKVPCAINGHDIVAYLNFDKGAHVYVVSSKTETNMFQTKFTQEEIDKMKEERRLSWVNFEQWKVPVEEA